MTERILVHAGVADSRMYSGQIEAFAPAQALDLPGFGRTPLESDTVDYRAFVRDHLPEQPAALIGTSMGARISLELALESPERVAALVLVGPGLDGGLKISSLEGRLLLFAEGLDLGRPLVAVEPGADEHERSHTLWRLECELERDSGPH